jgi:hypothetical protein
MSTQKKKTGKRKRLDWQRSAPKKKTKKTEAEPEQEPELTYIDSYTTPLWPQQLSVLAELDNTRLLGAGDQLLVEKPQDGRGFKTAVCEWMLRTPFTRFALSVGDSASFRGYRKMVDAMGFRHRVDLNQACVTAKPYFQVDQVNLVKEDCGAVVEGLQITRVE